MPFPSLQYTLNCNQNHHLEHQSPSQFGANYKCASSSSSAFLCFFVSLSLSLSLSLSVSLFVCLLLSLLSICASKAVVATNLMLLKPTSAPTRTAKIRPTTLSFVYQVGHRRRRVAMSCLIFSRHSRLAARESAGAFLGCCGARKTIDSQGPPFWLYIDTRNVSQKSTWVCNSLCVQTCMNTYT